MALNKSTRYHVVKTNMLLGLVAIIAVFSPQLYAQTLADYAVHCNNEPDCLLEEINHRPSKNAITQHCKKGRSNCVANYYDTYLRIGPDALLNVIDLCGEYVSCAMSASTLHTWGKLNQATEACHRDPICLITVQAHRLKDYSQAWDILELCQFSLSCIHSTSRISPHKIKQVLQQCDVEDYRCIDQTSLLSHIDDNAIATKIENVCQDDQACKRGYDNYYKHLQDHPNRFLSIMGACKAFTECLRYAHMLSEQGSLTKVIEFCNHDNLCIYTIGINRLSDYQQSQQLMTLCNREISCLRAVSYVPLPLSTKQQVINLCQQSSHCIRSLGIMMRGDQEKFQFLTNVKPNMLTRINNICTDSRNEIESYCLDRVLGLPFVWSFHDKIKGCRGMLDCVHKTLIQMSDTPEHCEATPQCHSLTTKLSQYEMGKEIAYLCEYNTPCLEAAYQATALRKQRNRQAIEQYCNNGGYCVNKREIANLGMIIDYTLLCQQATCTDFSTMGSDTDFFETMDTCAHHNTDIKSIRACYNTAQRFVPFSQRTASIEACRGEAACLQQ